jgi:AraC family transcriptional regulator, transcriptional activator of pobA
MNPMVDDLFAQLLSHLRHYRDYLWLMADLARLVFTRNGIPVYRYPTDQGTPPVSVLRMHADLPDERGRHIHDFPALAYDPATGLVAVAAAGATLEPSAISGSDGSIGVFFDAAALGDAGLPSPAWRTHPLLFPFLHGHSGGVLRLQVPVGRREFWTATIAAIDTELAGRLDGHRQAALAHLTLLLIDLARLADDVVGDLRRSGEPLMAEVFSVIESRVDEPLSLRDVAAEVGMTPGHLTTLVRRRTGRTVQDWIIERRMSRARALLDDTDLPIAEVARRVGMSDPGYFSRQFRRTYGRPPREWRKNRGAQRVS